MLSGTKNHPDQPNTCRDCGRKILKSKGSAMYYFDHVKGEHYSRCGECLVSGVRHVAPPARA